MRRVRLRVGSVSIAGLLAGESWDTNIADAAVADAARDRICPQRPQSILKKVVFAEKKSRASLTSTMYSVR